MTPDLHYACHLPSGGLNFRRDGQKEDYRHFPVSGGGFAWYSYLLQQRPGTPPDDPVNFFGYTHNVASGWTRLKLCFSTQNLRRYSNPLFGTMATHNVNMVYFAAIRALRTKKNDRSQNHVVSALVCLAFAVFCDENLGVEYILVPLFGRCVIKDIRLYITLPHRGQEMLNPWVSYS